MYRRISLASRTYFFFLLSTFLFLSGCAIQLAPEYDKAVADGLNGASTDTMTLMAIVAAGTKPDDYASRADKYATLIGKLDALAILAGSRPVPKNNVTEAINQMLSKRGVLPASDDGSAPPSVHAIRQISATITKMRDTDKKQGITAYEVIAFKGQATIYFDQAITYENFLQR